MGRPVSMKIGTRFGRLVVLSRSANLVRAQTRWLCRCDCGTIKPVYATHLRSGETVSCGCFGREQQLKAARTHQLTGDTCYKSWVQMLSRCRNSNDPSYDRYGGRGIEVCKRWYKFENFHADMAPRPSMDHSLDRMDVNGNYSKANCRWATRREQQRNRRNTKMLTHDGMTLPLPAWAERVGIPGKTLHMRLKLGWPLAEALNLAPRTREKRTRKRRQKT